MRYAKVKSLYNERGGNSLLKHFATLGPIGFIPLAPGTFGTLASALALYALRPKPGLYLGLLAAITLLGAIASGEAEKVTSKKDPSCIIIDEFAGYWIGMAFLPWTPGMFIATFVIFRILDIAKPPPLNSLQLLRGGLGVMADDIAAGVLTNLIIRTWMIWN